MSTTIAITGADGLSVAPRRDPGRVGYRVEPWSSTTLRLVGLARVAPSRGAGVHRGGSGDVRDRNSVLSLMTGRTWSATSPPHRHPYSYQAPGPTSRPTLVHLNVLEAARTLGTRGWCAPRPARSTAAPSSCRSPRSTRCSQSRTRLQDRRRQAGRELPPELDLPVVTLRRSTPTGSPVHACVIPTVIAQLAGTT